MPRNDIQKMILSELKELKTEIKEVRQTDIPSLHTFVATLRTELDNVKEKMSTKSMIITAVGGFIAIITSIAITYFK